MEEGGARQRLHCTRFSYLIVHDALAAETTLKLPPPREHGAVDGAGGGVVGAEAHASTAPLPQTVSQGGLPVVLVGVGQGELSVLRVAPRVADGG